MMPDDYRKMILFFLLAFCFLLGWFIGKLLLIAYNLYISG
tara:strand:- start:434 stop:553 length:120 start_codon:yes stop_codon:yes gene_type:complete